MCMHIAEKLGVEGAKKHGLTDRMEFRKKSNIPVPPQWHLFGLIQSLGIQLFLFETY